MLEPLILQPHVVTTEETINHGRRSCGDWPIKGTEYAERNFISLHPVYLLCSATVIRQLMTSGYGDDLEHKNHAVCLKDGP